MIGQVGDFLAVRRDLRSRALIGFAGGRNNEDARMFVGMGNVALPDVEIARDALVSETISDARERRIRAGVIELDGSVSRGGGDTAESGMAAAVGGKDDGLRVEGPLRRSEDVGVIGSDLRCLAAGGWNDPVPQLEALSLTTIRRTR